MLLHFQVLAEFQLSLEPGYSKISTAAIKYSGTSNSDDNTAEFSLLSDEDLSH